MTPNDDIACDVLLLFATKTEEEQLGLAAKEQNVLFEGRSDPVMGLYYDLGLVGTNRVKAVRTRMGPFGHRGSAAQAIHCQTRTSAQSIVQLGMAFGINRKVQYHGDVLVSKFVFPYDYRVVEETEQGYRSDYADTQHFPAKQALFALFQDEFTSRKPGFQVHFGGLLSGGARIRSQRFLKELVSAIEAGTGAGGLVGGEMEGVGLLSVSERAKPIWIVVKGICDFADDQRDAEIAAARPKACHNAATFVLSALSQWGQG